MSFKLQRIDRQSMFMETIKAINKKKVSRGYKIVPFFIVSFVCVISATKVTRDLSRFMGKGLNILKLEIS